MNKKYIKDVAIWVVVIFVIFALVGWINHFGSTGVTHISPAACWGKSYNATTMSLIRKEVEKAVYDVVPPKVQKGIFHGSYKNAAPYVSIENNAIHNRILKSADTQWFGSKDWNGRVYCQGAITYTVKVPLSVSQNSGYTVTGTVSGNYMFAPTPNAFYAYANGDWSSASNIGSQIVSKVQTLQNNNVAMTVLNIKNS